MRLQEDAVYRFAGFELQPGERRLLLDREPVALTPKVFDTLILLVERAGHVVTKDELMASLWPGRFVAESNLTKHIWTLRKSLGESEEGDGYIETVPKVGYRFVAPVIRAGAATSEVTPSDSSVTVAFATVLGSQTPPRRRPLGIATAVLAAFLLLAVAGAAVWSFWPNQSVAPVESSAPASGAVAIVEFDNLSRNPKDAWVGPAAAEMLGTDMSLGGKLHALPGELVRAAKAGLPDPQTGGYAPASLAKLLRRLDADYVVSGSYLASGTSDNPPLRLDYSVQNARTGATIAAFTRTGSLADLPTLVTQAGADLRKQLGIAPNNGKDANLAATLQPPSSDVMRHVGFALDALHHYDGARARDELLQAITEAPDYAPAYAYLAKAWSALGYKSKALAAAEQAEALSEGLPESMRLDIAVQRYEAQFDWPRAIASLRKLVTLKPKDPEERLELINALLAAGKSGDAAVALDALRRLGDPARQDARLELAAARIAAARDDTKDRTAHSEKALQLAMAHGERGLSADAELQLGIATGDTDPKAAGRFYQSALEDYRSVGNPSGEAGVHRDIGNLYMYSDPQRAREEYQESLSEYQSIGDQNGIASAYSDLGLMLWLVGDRDGAEAATRNVLNIRRETGDIAGQAWAIAALAVAQSDDAASDESISGFREAAALDERIGEHSHRGFSLMSLADVLRLRGDLGQAQTVCAEAQVEYAKVKDAASPSLANFECAQVALDRGDLAKAERGFTDARATAARIGDAMDLANADLSLGQIEMGRRNWADAGSKIGSAIKEYEKADLVTGEAVAYALMALCDASLSKTPERDFDAARARKLRSRVTERQEVIQVDIALAELSAQSGEKDRALSQLNAIAQDSRKRKWPGWALEANLATMRVYRHFGDTAKAAAVHASIATTARQMGFGWVLQRLGP